MGLGWYVGYPLELCTSCLKRSLLPRKDNNNLYASTERIFERCSRFGLDESYSNKKFGNAIPKHQTIIPLVLQTHAK